MAGLLITLLVSFLAARVSAAPGGIVLSGPSGVVTDHGPIGPAALGLGGYGAHGGGAPHVPGPTYLAGPQAGPSYLAGPQAGPASVIGPRVGPAHLAGPQTGPVSVVGPQAGPAHIVGPQAGSVSVVGPAAGLGLGYGGHGGALAGSPGGYSGYGGYSGLDAGYALGPSLGHQGITVRGPQTVQATIAGPAGRVVADGLYGLPMPHGHGWQ